MQVYDRLRILRQYKKTSTHYLSKVTGIGQSTISRMELGETKICVDHIVLFSEALSVPVEAFFYDNKMLEAMQGDKND